MEHIYYPLTPEIERLGEEEVFKPVPPEVKAELQRWRRERERQEQQKQTPPQEEPVLPPQEEAPQEPPPPQEDKFEKLFGAPLARDAEDVRTGRAFGPARNPLDDRLSSVESGDGEVSENFKATFERMRRRAEQKRTFNALTLLFERPKDRPADDKASSVKTGSTDAPKHFEAAQRPGDVGRTEHGDALGRFAVAACAAHCLPIGL